MGGNFDVCARRRSVLEWAEQRSPAGRRRAGSGGALGGATVAAYPSVDGRWRQRRAGGVGIPRGSRAIIHVVST